MVRSAAPVLMAELAHRESQGERPDDLVGVVIERPRFRCVAIVPAHEVSAIAEPLGRIAADEARALLHRPTGGALRIFAYGGGAVGGLRYWPHATIGGVA